MNLVKTPSNYAGKAAVSIPDSGEFGQQCQAANSMVEVLDRVIASVCESGGAELKDFLATKMNIPSLEGEGFGDTAQAGDRRPFGRLSARKASAHICVRSFHFDLSARPSGTPITLLEQRPNVVARFYGPSGRLKAGGLRIPDGGL